MLALQNWKTRKLTPAHRASFSGFRSAKAKVSSRARSSGFGTASVPSWYFAEMDNDRDELLYLMLLFLLAGGIVHGLLTGLMAL